MFYGNTNNGSHLSIGFSGCARHIVVNTKGMDYRDASGVKKMNVVVKYSGHLSSLTGKKKEAVNVGEKGTLGSLLHILCGQYNHLPPLHEGLIYMVNGKIAGKEQILAEDDEIQIFQPMAGG